MSFELVIFDCDGVLVDSEPLSAHVLMTMMAEIGRPMSYENFKSDFLGRSFATAAQLSEKRFGAPLPDRFQLQYRDRLLTHIRDHLKAMPGVETVLSTLRIPFCLATSSSPQRLATTLEATKLQRFFVDRHFTASQVEHGKPAPDLFLFTAKKMNADITKCLIVEDSEMGLRAAIASGAETWRFVGGSHIDRGDQLPKEAVPKRNIVDMNELHSAFAALGLCSETKNAAVLD